MQNILGSLPIWDVKEAIRCFVSYRLDWNLHKVLSDYRACDSVFYFTFQILTGA